MTKAAQTSSTRKPLHARLKRAVGDERLSSPQPIRQKLDRLKWQLEDNRKRMKKVEAERDSVQEFLNLAPQVTDALDVLSQKLFEEVLGALETHLSIALQEVLEQPIHFKADATFKNKSAHIEFSIERNGNPEDVNRGVGGSVQNILSVGLRMFALASLDEAVHGRFLVLDEQDCWLRAELVPRLVNMIHKAADELGFQVILISHHDVDLFNQYADKIYRLDPTAAALKIEEVNRSPQNMD